MLYLDEDLDKHYPDYFCWLCEMVCVDGRCTDEAYWLLAKALWDTDYIWLVDMDQNREQDGLYLRRRYTAAGGTDSYDGPCTVLEVLIALADRIDILLDEVDGECRIPLYFWEMVENLGLAKYSDAYFIGGEGSGYDCVLEVPDREEIDDILETWLMREYNFDGSGGLFPLDYPKEDQREVDLWYQANAYILEKYWKE